MLLSRHSRRSKQREAIFSLLDSVKTHPTAEWIYSQLKAQMPGLSLGTVYRNLSLFKTEGSAVIVASVEGQERFDSRVEPHAHFICRKCSQVLDLDEVPMPAPYSELSGIESRGLKIETAQLNFYGLCNNCGASNKNEK